MTKFIYDTKSIMTRAWEIARNRKAQAKSARNSVAWFFPVSLEMAWSEAKNSMVKAVAADKAKTSPRGRYVELLSVAERDGLNHGRSWYLNSDTCSVYGFNPMHEGELICYVYSN